MPPKKKEKKGKAPKKTNPEVVSAATLQVECLIEQSHLEDVLRQIEDYEKENKILKDKIDNKQVAKSKVFSYLHDKVLDSNQQLLEIESTFIKDKKTLENLKNEIKKQTLLLETNKTNDWNKVDGENQILRDQITLYNKYEKEMNALDNEKSELVETLAKTKAQQHEEMTSRAAKHEATKRHAQAVAKADIEVVAQKATRECDKYLGDKTKALFVENDIIVQELEHQKVAVSALETRVLKIEAENQILRSKLKKAKEAEDAVAQIMHLKQQELKELTHRLEECSLLPSTSSSSSAIVVGSSSSTRRSLNMNHPTESSSSSSSSYVSSYSKKKTNLSINSSSYHNNNPRLKGKFNKDEIYNQNNHSKKLLTNIQNKKVDKLDDYNEMLRREVNEKTMQIKQRMEEVKRDKLKTCLKDVKEQNYVIDNQIAEVEVNFEKLMDLQQEDEHLTVILGISEDLYNQQHSANYNNQYNNHSRIHSSTSSMRSYFDDDSDDSDDDENDDDERKYFKEIRNRVQGEHGGRRSGYEEYQGMQLSSYSPSSFSPTSSSSNTTSNTTNLNNKKKRKQLHNFLNLILSEIQRIETRDEDEELNEEEEMRESQPHQSLPSIWQ